MHTARGALVLVSSLSLVLALPARAQTTDPHFPLTDGRVYASARSGDTLYVGGNFTNVGPQTGCFALLDEASGTRLAGLPRVEGVVHAVASDGAGGWYVGGQFQRVAGVPRTNAAHIRADGTLDAWTPSPNGVVYALARIDGVVYAGGSFLNIGGLARPALAALDPVTGAATTWTPAGTGTETAASPLPLR